MNRMDTPRTRAEFERNFDLLNHQLEEGKMQFPIGYPMDSLMRIRYLPNGRIDFLSVDEMARLNANTSGHFNEEFLKELMEREGHRGSCPSTDGDESEF